LIHKALVFPSRDGKASFPSCSGDGGSNFYIETTPFLLPTTMAKAIATMTQHLSNF